MKKYLLFVFTLFFLSASAQKKKEHNFDFLVSYGPAYIDYAQSSNYDPVNLEIPSIGSFLEFNLDYKLKGGRHIGLGFSKQEHSKTINEQLPLYTSNGIVVLDNFYHSHKKIFYDVHFGTTFRNHFTLNVGLGYFIDYYNRSDYYGFTNGEWILVFSNEKNRADHFSVFLSLEYYFPITDYLDLGIKGKYYQSLNGMENVSLLPTLKVSF